MLQLVLHLPPHPYQLVAMQQQLPQIPLLRARHPDPRKSFLQQQLQQQLSISSVGLLFAYFQGSDLARISQPQLVPNLASRRSNHSVLPQASISPTKTGPGN